MIFTTCEPEARRARAAIFRAGTCEPAIRATRRSLMPAAVRHQGRHLCEHLARDAHLADDRSAGLHPLLRRTNVDGAAGAGRRAPGARTRVFDHARATMAARCSAGSANYLASHAELWLPQPRLLETRGRDHPFVLRSRTGAGGTRLPTLQLIYCRDIERFRRASPGRSAAYLLGRGIPVADVDATARSQALSAYFHGQRAANISKGRSAPRLGDLAYHRDRCSSAHSEDLSMYAARKHAGRTAAGAGRPA